MHEFTVAEVAEFFEEEWGAKVFWNTYRHGVEITFGGSNYGGSFRLRLLGSRVVAFGQMEGDSDDCSNFDHFMERHGVVLDDDFVMVNTEW